MCGSGGGGRRMCGWIAPSCWELQEGCQCSCQAVMSACLCLSFCVCVCLSVFVSGTGMARRCCFHSLVQ